MHDNVLTTRAGREHIPVMQPKPKIRLKNTPNRQPTVVDEAQTISEATQTATVAARSILASGGSQATALKTAKAAAKSSLMGNNAIESDAGSVISTSSSYPRWNRKRKVKRQADIVASMALAAASNSLNSGFQKPSGAELPQLMSQPPLPGTIQGYPTTLESPMSNGSHSRRKPPLSPKSLSAVSRTESLRSGKSRPTSPDFGNTMAMEVLSLTEQESHKSSSSKKMQAPPFPEENKQHVSLGSSTDTETDKSNGTAQKQHNDKDITAVDLNSEDPIYWGNSSVQKVESNKSEENEVEPVAASGSTDSEGISDRSKSHDIVFENVTEDSEYTDDEGTLEDLPEEEDLKPTAVEKTLSPFFESFETVFGCACSGKEDNIEDRYQEEAEDDDDMTLEPVEERDMQEENNREGGELRSDDTEEVYHTIVLKSRYDPDEGTKEKNPKRGKKEDETVQSDSKSIRSRRRKEKTRSKKKGKLFRRKKEVTEAF